jgi:hypothetical protein
LNDNENISIGLISETNDEWFLQQLDNSGEILSSNLETYGGSLNFKATNLRYAYQIKNSDTDWNRFDIPHTYSDKDGLNLDLTSSHSIHATLTATDDTDYPINLSMLGSNQKIDNISLIISKHKDTNCKLEGHESFFIPQELGHKSYVSSIYVFLELSPEKFDELAGIINSGGADEAFLSLEGVSGLYSELSMLDYSSQLKVLLGEHKVTIPKDVDIKPHRLRSTKEFTFQLKKAHKKMGSVPSKETHLINNLAKQRANNEVKRFCEDEDEHGHYTFNENREKRLTRTNKYKILKEIYFEAYKYSLEKNLTDRKLEELIGEIDNVILGIENALDSFEFNDNQSTEDRTKYFERLWQLWQYPEIDILKIYEGKRTIPNIDIDELKYSLTEYLKLPVRNKNIDRLLVDVLVTNETEQFSAAMLYNNKYYPDHLKSPLLISHPLWRFIKAQVINFAVISLIPIFILFASVSLFDFNESWAAIIGFGFLGIWVLLFLIGILTLPNFWITEIKNKQKIIKLIDAMLIVRREISGNVVSAKHILERLNKTSEVGAIWPSEVFALLDDIIDRNGIF